MATGAAADEAIEAAGTKLIAKRRFSASVWTHALPDKLINMKDANGKESKHLRETPP